MAVAVDITAYNGARITYGRVIKISTDFQTRQSVVTLGGYTSREARDMGQAPMEVLTADFVLPDPIPTDVVAFTYAALAAAHPGIDFSEV